MSSFDDYKQERRDSRKWFWWGLSFVVLLVLLFGVLKYAGVFADTVVERKVFENSYQRSESIKTQIATYEAQIAELEHQLQNPQLDDNTKSTINSQLAAIRIQLATARGRE